MDMESRNLNDGVEKADNKKIFEYLLMGELLQHYLFGLTININESLHSMGSNTVCTFCVKSLPFRSIIAASTLS